ncbi:MAG: sugar phosphate nucleotidyltransferase, partial [Spirochaetota bacterium]|nr:sugar phosphate nucleotidyltransferase [Spirochaetota bacterium]
MIKAVIMAGGEGTRLRPLTSNRPKPMIPVINKPVIEHTINLLKKQGITDIIISLFYRPESVQNYFADGSDWDVNITYSVEETPLGTAGGVKKAIGDCNDTFIVLSGDGVIDFNITKIFEYHKEKESQLTIVLKHVKEPIDYGIVIINDEGRIVKFFEKPAWSQVFSDTVNTGMYLLEPSILDHIPEGKSDFSMDIFPSLHEKDIPLYGYVSDGYWCDIGDLNSYRDAHLAILDGLVAIDFPGKKIGENVWAGKDVDISNDAVIKGPAILGDFVKIKKGAEVAEFCVIGDNIVVEENASVRRSIIYHGTIIGQKSELRGAIVGKRCVLEEAVSIYEGAVVSDDCQIGSGVEIPSGIRVWPDKVIEQGTKLTTDLIWGQREKKTLFSSEGIVGSFNIKITPEFAAKLGSALGAFLSKNSKVVISRDTTLASRLIKRGITSGLLSMGINVYDIEIESIPINRHTIRLLNADMGIYVQKSPFAGLQYIQIKIFDKNGFQISINDEKKIENIFFRGDYPRKDAFEVGSIFFPIHQIESYISNVKNYINFELLEKKKWNMIVDCFNGSASNVFPDLLASFGCQLTVFRGQAKEFASMEDVKNETRKTIDNIISMTKSNKEIGVIIGPHGEYITIVDEMGNILSNDDISAILCISYLKFKNEKILNIPVTSSMILDEIAYSYGGKVIRISSKIRSPENI